jgi:hypothetical protein
MFFRGAGQLAGHDAHECLRRFGTRLIGCDAINEFVGINELSPRRVSFFCVVAELQRRHLNGVIKNRTCVQVWPTLPGCLWPRLAAASLIGI